MNETSVLCVRSYKQGDNAASLRFQVEYQQKLTDEEDV
jgi:hypothetical protein